MTDRVGTMSFVCLAMILLGAVAGQAGDVGGVVLRPAEREGIDIFLGGRVLAPIRLCSNGLIVAQNVEAKVGSVRLNGLCCKDPGAISFALDDFVSVDLPPGEPPRLRFQMTVKTFDAARWRALFSDGPAPFHFLSCSVPTAQVWHQRGWLNATPNADPFPLLGDTHVGTPELSCTWNRNWSYLCPLGAHPVPMIGAWDPPARLYVGYDFQGARAADQSERYIATAYCWRQGDARSFITLAWPYGGERYGQLVYPKPGDRIDSWCHVIVDPDLPPTEDPNERFQSRLFAHYRASLPRVPERSDLSWMPGAGRLGDFAGPAGLGLFGPGGEETFYPAGTVLIHGWGGHREMPVDAAVRRGDVAAIEHAQRQLETLLTKYAKRVTIDGDECLFWQKPLEGAWRRDWGGPGVTTLHNSDAWYPARVLVELYRYDRARGNPRPEYLKAIDGIYRWTRRFVWTRNEFADVPSSPFAIGCTLSTAFLLDYYFTFRDDPHRRGQADEALRLADRLVWRYLPIWAMDSDRFDAALDSSFLIEPNSGRDWAGLACANEVHWVVDTLPVVYVHTGDQRLRWYLRGILDRWPQLYRAEYEESLASCAPASMTEGLGFFDGCGPGRGNRYEFGAADCLAMLEPVGNSRMRIVAGTRSALACCKGGAHGDLADYRTDGRGACSFRIVSELPGEFDVSFSYPMVDVSRLGVTLTRDGRARELEADRVRRPPQSPSSLYLARLRNGDVVQVGRLSATVQSASSPTWTEPGGTDGQRVLRAARDFVVVPLAGDCTLQSDWSDRKSFAGLSPGLRWTCRVPLAVNRTAASRPIDLDAPSGRAVFVAYAPPEAIADRSLVCQAAAERPVLVLDDGRPLPLSGKPVLAWQAWPPSFERFVLLDRAELPAGRRLRRLDPTGTLVLGATVFVGGPEALKAVDVAYAPAVERCAAMLRARAESAALRREFASLPAGKIAILPGAAGGPAVGLLSRAEIKAKTVSLSGPQLADPSFFTPGRFPVALYFNNEDYPKTVHREGDGRAAIIRYLAGGGTLVLLASGPFPLYYGTGPGGAHKPDPLLPYIGLPIHGDETPPAGLRFVRNPGQEILRGGDHQKETVGIPETFPFADGDGRLRAVPREQLDRAHRYTPLLKAVDGEGRDYGDVACWIELKAGPAAGGKIVYIWSSLQSGPHGNAILSDALRWALRGL